MYILHDNFKGKIFYGKYIVYCPKFNPPLCKMYERQKGTDWSTLSQEMNQPRNTKIQYHRKCGDNIFLANSQSLLNICSILFFCLSMVTIKVSNAGTSGFKREVKPRFIIFWFSENFVSTNYLFGNNVAAYWPAITKCTLQGRIQTIHYLQGLFSIFSLPLSSSLKIIVTMICLMTNMLWCHGVTRVPLYCHFHTTMPL